MAADEARTITYTYGSREYTARIPKHWRVYHAMTDIPQRMPRADRRYLKCTRCNIPGLRLGVLPGDVSAIPGEKKKLPSYDITYTSKTIA